MFVYNPPTEPWLEFIYRDEDIIVVNKPPGLLTVPGKDIQHKDSVYTRVTTSLPSARIIHRLDMATSGILVMALHKKAQGEMGKQFEKRTVHKTYEAEVLGKLAEHEGMVNLPLRCDWPNRPKQMVDHEEGKPAQTNFKVLSHQTNSTRVELKPITGRSHQLRVHMLSLGHPILGDRLYGEPVAVKQSPRLLLHAREIEFHHPITNEPMCFEIPTPF
ncbi:MULTISPECIES: RluA family pseudouridine synthase [Gammaproteobacteria]|uniref:RluA family pseudouridine synthase n=1 Tax=Gammaproteobacteria TaxID=1236 RepID=UPI000DCF7B80|nr:MULTISPECIES: RluA family pseudouridine synthase [Gammaproteobacteria]RTE85616.1 RluA family pseudouridine synthase [Aliidiomarina sp. B3213]TCZ89585.1 RluA family pseudouridine synthase [Lysobacter sp. N42]